jgi:hypothetical protein
MVQINALATEARNDYQARPYYGPRPIEPGAMSGGFAETRDSDALERSNFRQALAAFEAEGVEVSIDHFGHWAVGWIDYLTVPITTTSIRILADLAARIESYPVLNDEDFSELEWEDNHPGDGYCYDSEYRYYAERGDEGCPCGLPYIDERYA